MTALMFHQRMELNFMAKLKNDRAKGGYNMRSRDP